MAARDCVLKVNEAGEMTRNQTLWGLVGYGKNLDFIINKIGRKLQEGFEQRSDMI